MWEDMKKDEDKLGKDLWRYRRMKENCWASQELHRISRFGPHNSKFLPKELCAGILRPESTSTRFEPANPMPWSEHVTPTKYHSKNPKLCLDHGGRVWVLVQVTGIFHRVKRASLPWPQLLVAVLHYARSYWTKLFTAAYTLDHYKTVFSLSQKHRFQLYT